MLTNCLAAQIPIYLQQFPSYSNRKCKKSPFLRTAAHIFVSSGDALAIITQYVAWMERQFNACQTPHSIHLSIFNSFRVQNFNLQLALSKQLSNKSDFTERPSAFVRTMWQDVRLSDIRRYCVETAKHILKLFFTVWQLHYSTFSTPNGNTAIFRQDFPLQERQIQRICKNRDFQPLSWK